MIELKIDFSRTIRPWDGFGVNYVEVSMTPDYSVQPQDYGGFSTLSEGKRQEIIEMIFGEDGLKPGIVKMFFDPFQQREDRRNGPGLGELDLSNYDHETTTRWMRYFVREGLKRTRARGGDLSIITTLYGPPGWMTKQRFVRGRDFDPACELELAKYYVAWVKYLRDVEKFPVHYVSLHNEGEDFVRWPEDGASANWEHGHDYNMWWPPELVVRMVKRLRQALDVQGLQEVGVTPGETTDWFRFVEWGYAAALADDDEAMRALGLVTSHGFISNWKRWVGDHRSTGIDLLHEKRPDLHCWTTSTSWKQMDVQFLRDYRDSIYAAKNNAVIPWACIQYPVQWKKGDPNPGCAFKVDGQGGYSVEPGYHFYKQMCRAGQPGMAVARVISNDTQLLLAAFAANGTGHPHAFVLLNTAAEAKRATIRIAGSNASRFAAWRTSPQEQYAPLGELPFREGAASYEAPAGSATTFFAV